MKILVMGSGGIGGYFGGRLAEAGADVFFVARGPHLEALRRDGLRVTSVAGGFHLSEVAASADPKDAGPVDVVILATKYGDVETAARLAKPVLKEEGFVVHFQNGIDVADRIATVLDRRQLVGGSAYGVVQLVAPGHIDHGTQVHSLVYGRFPETFAPGLEAFHRACARSKFQSELVTDIETRIWSKFLFIGAYSGMTSLLRLPIGPIVADPDTRRAYEACLREIAALATAKGIVLPDGLVEDRLEFSRRALEPTATSSMQRDFAAGRPTELLALNGTVSRLGKELGVATPVNDVIFAALKLHDPALR